MARLLASNQATGVRLPDPAVEAVIDASLAERSGTGLPGPTGGFDSRWALVGERDDPGCRKAWPIRLPWEQEIAGSNPAIPTL